MRSVSQSDAPSLLPSLLEQVAREPVVIQRDGREIAYLISPEEYAIGRDPSTQGLLQAYQALATEIAENVQRKGLDVEDLMKSLDRKAS